MAKPLPPLPHLPPPPATRHSEPKNFDDRASHLNYRGERAEKIAKKKQSPELARQT